MTPPPWTHPLDERLKAQIHFVLAADALKGVLRGSRIADGSRRENTAEHSWHVALLADVLAEWAVGTVDTGRAVRMLLMHDLVEIDAGDTPLLEQTEAADHVAAERAAAERLFGMLPAAPCAHASGWRS